MLEFEWPWLALALLLPFAVLLLPAKAKPQASALLVDNVADFTGSGAEQSNSKTKNLIWLLALLAYAALTLASMRPVWVGEEIEIPLEGRDLMLAIDLSLSMREQDMQSNSRQVSRMRATKEVATQFVEKRVGDRIGLVVFGAYPYLQTPLTFDRKTIIENIAKSQMGDADDMRRRIHGTSIGDAIGISVKRLRESEIADKTLILITDGTDTSSQLPPLKAAELAAQDGLKIYTIGIGSDHKTASLMGFSFNTGKRAEIDEDTLQKIAQLTGGQYFRARDTAELKKIYALIDELEPIQSDAMSFKPRSALFYYPLSFALLLSALMLLAHSLQGLFARGLKHA